ncbi:hypothetical protein [Methylomonas sp. AM2-LC]|uniref:hypothetical protein n=1 Tax=Methylomonas sp. AM2-LC TaxID=3153301 RepID=UPI003265DF9F
MPISYLSYFSRVIAVGCCFTGNVMAQTSVNAPQNLPAPALKSAPVAQALVPEGVYAIQLLPVLQQNATTNDAQAEAILIKLGIAPKNGWISDYPITPAVLGELDTTIGIAAEQGKIPLAKSQALKQVGELKVKLGLDIGISPSPQTVTASPQIHTIYTYIDSKGSKMFTDDYNSIPPTLRAQAKIISQSSVTPSIAPVIPTSTPVLPPPTTSLPQAKPTVDPETLAGYYQNQGPPVITYYQPPDQYNNYYSWVPYPFWSGGYSYPGFYVLNNFQQQVYYNQKQYIVAGHRGGAIRNNADPDRDERNERMPPAGYLPNAEQSEHNERQERWYRQEQEHEHSLEAKQFPANQHPVESHDQQLQSPASSEVFRRIQEQEKLQMQATQHHEHSIQPQQHAFPQANVEQQESRVPSTVSPEVLNHHQHESMQMQGNQSSEPVIQPQPFPHNSRNFEHQEQHMQLPVNPGK